MTDLSGDLNATIASAINAKIEGAVLAALSGDDVFGRYVTAALQQQVEPKDRYSNRTRVTFLQRVVEDAIQEATKAAVARLLVEEAPLIEEELRKAFKRSAGTMAEGIVSSLSANAAKGYGVTVELRIPGDRY